MSPLAENVVRDGPDESVSVAHAAMFYLKRNMEPQMNVMNADGGMALRRRV